MLKLVIAADVLAAPRPQCHRSHPPAVGDTSWILELVSSELRGGKPFRQVHYFLTTLRKSPKALLRLVRQRWAMTFSRTVNGF